MYRLEGDSEEIQRLSIVVWNYHSYSVQARISLKFPSHGKIVQDSFSLTPDEMTEKEAIWSNISLEAGEQVEIQGNLADVHELEGMQALAKILSKG